MEINTKMFENLTKDLPQYSGQQSVWFTQRAPSWPFSKTLLRHHLSAVLVIITSTSRTTLSSNNRGVDKENVRDNESGREYAQHSSLRWTLETPFRVFNSRYEEAQGRENGNMKGIENPTSNFWPVFNASKRATETNEYLHPWTPSQTCPYSGNVKPDRRIVGLTHPNTTSPSTHDTNTMRGPKFNILNRGICQFVQTWDDMDNG